MASKHVRPSFPRRFGTAVATIALSLSTIALMAPSSLAATACSGATNAADLDVPIPGSGDATIEYVGPGALNVTITGVACAYYTNVSTMHIYKSSGNDSETVTIIASNTELLPDTEIDLDNGNFDELILEGTGGSDNLDATVFDFGNGKDVDFLTFDAMGGNDVMVDTRDIFDASHVTFGGSGGVDVADRSDRTKSFTFTLPVDVENLIGGAGSDTLKGNLSANRIFGGRGNDDIYGYGGNDLLVGEEGDDDLYAGDGNDTLVGGEDDDKFDGGTGVDVVSYNDAIYPDAASSGVVFSLRWTSKQETRGADKDYAVANTVETVIGSTYDDSLTGDTRSNSIDGNLGDDEIEGGAGEDVLDGGLGVDTLSYDRSPAGVRVNLAQPYPTGGDANGDLTGGFENARGSDFADTLTGTAGDNGFFGGDGNDLLIGLGGADSFDGGLGTHDRITYAGSSAGVTVSLLDGVGVGGDAEGDSYTRVEDVVGSEKADIIIGGRVANVLVGLGGNDMFMGGFWGDTIDGGAGVDTASYSDAAERVEASLRSGLVSGGGGGSHSDRLISIENLIGSRFGDTLIGSDGANNINGGGGDDVVSGLGGSDKLFGSGGGDRLEGGDGNDFLEPGSGDDTVDGGAGTDTCRVGTGKDDISACEK